MIWFNKKNKYFRGFRVFDFVQYPKSKTQKPRKSFFYFNFLYYMKPTNPKPKKMT